nr:hypothetical protein [Anaerolinea sp.]
QQTAAFYGSEQAQEKVEDAILGIYQALVEMRLPFEMVHDGLLDEEHTRPFQLLILPNIAALSERQCEQLRAFVARGGSLIATGETSLYDEDGEKHSEFGLADLFGVRYQGSRPGPMKNAYLRLEWPAEGQAPHPLLRGFEGAQRIIAGVNWQDVEPSEPLEEKPITFIPPYPDLPMEKVYPREGPAGIPGVYLHRYGRGRVAYFPWDIDRVYWEILCADHGRLLWNTVDWALEGRRDLYVEGPGLLDVAVWRQAQSITIHLVNLSNPLLMKGPLREFLPIGAQHIRFRLPAGLRARGVHLLVKREPVEWTEQAGELRFTVPSILDHEVVAIDIVVDDANRPG